MRKTMKAHFYPVLAFAALALCATFACNSNPTSPSVDFAGPSSQGGASGATLNGTFQRSPSAFRASRTALTAQARTEFDGITVSIRQDGSLSTAVASNGTFSLSGIPRGNVTADFRRDGSRIGSITFRDVLANQEIRIVVALTESDQVVLLDQERDQVDNGECLARGDGFWCNNPPEDFPTLAAAVAEGFATIEDENGVQFFDLDGDGDVDVDDIALAVCLTGNQAGINQLLRKMATMALNLEAGWLTDDGPLNTAIGVLEGPNATKADRNAIKDDLEALNECGEVDDGEEDDGEPPPATPCDAPPGAKKITICHKGKNTLSISVNAWPAHAAHQDTCGPC